MLILQKGYRFFEISIRAAMTTLVSTFSLATLVVGVVLLAATKLMAGSSWKTALCLLGILASGVFLGGTTHTPGIYRVPVTTTFAAVLYFLAILGIYLESRIPAQPVAGDETTNTSAGAPTSAESPTPPESLEQA